MWSYNKEKLPSLRWFALRKKHGKITLTVSPRKAFTHLLCECFKSWRYKYLLIARFSSKKLEIPVFCVSNIIVLFFEWAYMVLNFIILEAGVLISISETEVLRT